MGRAVPAHPDRVAVLGGPAVEVQVVQGQAALAAVAQAAAVLAEAFVPVAAAVPAVVVVLVVRAEAVQAVGKENNLKGENL